MYQNFDEKYITINYDEGSSATMTQTTLAYWDKDYGKKLLTSEEQLGMYLQPKITSVIKYLMYDNMSKLVDANAFVKCEKIEDALNNYKYNFYTKRNVRYTILFPAQFHSINSIYLDNFEKLYKKQLEILETKGKEEKTKMTKQEKHDEEIKKEIEVVETFDIDSYKNEKVEEKKEIKVENINPFEERKEVKSKPEVNVDNLILKKKQSKVVFNDGEIKEEEKPKKKEINKEDLKEELDSILKNLDI